MRHNAHIPSRWPPCVPAVSDSHSLFLLVMFGFFAAEPPSVLGGNIQFLLLAPRPIPFHFSSGMPRT